MNYEVGKQKQRVKTKAKIQSGNKYPLLVATDPNRIENFCNNNNNNKTFATETRMQSTNGI